MKFLVRVPKLYQEPKSAAPPPFWIRGLLILTCTGVSFFHGGNDGQKGMGLIMLILIGAAPTAYALNRTMPEAATPAFVTAASAAQNVFAAHAGGQAAPDVGAARTMVGNALARQEAQRSESLCRAFGSVGRHRRQCEELQVPQPCAGGSHAQPAQRHVPDRRRHPPPAQAGRQVQRR